MIYNEELNKQKYIAVIYIKLYVNTHVKISRESQSGIKYVDISLLSDGISKVTSDMSCVKCPFPITK